MRIAKSVFLAAAIVVGAAGSLSISAAVAQTANSPVLVVNLQKIREESPAWSDMSTKLRTLVEQKTNEFRSQNQAAAQTLQNEGTALRPLLQGKTEAQVNADPALKTRLEAQMRRERDLSQKQQLFEYSVRATTEAADRQLLGLLDPIVDQIMTQRGAVVVMDASQIAKARPAIDITADAQTRFNAANPRAPQPTWVPVTIAPPDNVPANAQKK